MAKDKLIRLSIALNRKDWERLESLAKHETERLNLDLPISTSAMARKAIREFIVSLDQQAQVHAHTP